LRICGRSGLNLLDHIKRPAPPLIIVIGLASRYSNRSLNSACWAM